MKYFAYHENIINVAVVLLFHVCPIFFRVIVKNKNNENLSNG